MSYEILNVEPIFPVLVSYKKDTKEFSKLMYISKLGEEVIIPDGEDIDLKNSLIYYLRNNKKKMNIPSVPMDVFKKVKTNGK